ncbi:MAG TPA: hypothetical protein VGQ85_05615, partial [Candidatus Limnocylindrales bacterium]|nr:hypothetical protein [Candidatus Limnocylindrales bacterium]
MAQDTGPEDTAPDASATDDGSATDNGTPADGAAGAARSRRPSGPVAARAARSSRTAELVEPEAPPAPPTPWRVDTEGGSLAPRSSLDILIDVNDKVMSGQIADYEPVPLGMPP